MKQGNKGKESSGCFLEVRDVVKRFGSFTALDNVSLYMEEGEFVSILGPSGCGKTTLLRVVAGMEQQNSGEIYLNGTDISRLHTSKRNCGIVFQSYALFPNLTAQKNVMFGIKDKKMNRSAKAARAHELLELVGLAELAAKYPAQMSGGQQQRVALARALATSPQMLLLDEPLSALDAKVRLRLRTEIRSLQKRLGITTIMVTHDQEEALTMADRIIVMKQGKLIQYASPQDIYSRPADPFVADFIGAMNFFPFWRVKDRSTINYGRLQLKVTGCDTGSLLGEDVTIAIRPEDIRVLDHANGDDNVLRAVVETVEFRGSSYRLRLKLHEDTPTTKDIYLDADVQAEDLARLGISEQATVPLQFPHDRILMFPDPHLQGSPSQPGQSIVH